MFKTALYEIAAPAALKGTKSVMRILRSEQNAIRRALSMPHRVLARLLLAPFFNLLLIAHGAVKREIFALAQALIALFALSVAVLSIVFLGHWLATWGATFALWHKFGIVTALVHVAGTNVSVMYAAIAKVGVFWVINALFLSINERHILEGIWRDVTGPLPVPAKTELVTAAK